MYTQRAFNESNKSEALGLHPEISIPWTVYTLLTRRR